MLDRPFPTFPHGFSADLIAEFERRIGRGTIGNVVASGTEIIDRLGAEHMRTGKPIVYTSADSVFQIAAHEDVIPIAEQYRICEIAFDLVGRGMGVGRVIARPFVGAPGSFKRTANRHDYALEPTGETLLDRLTPRRYAGRFDRESQRSVRRPRHHPRDAHGQRRGRHGASLTRRCAMRATVSSSSTWSTSIRCTGTATTCRGTRRTSSGSTRRSRACCRRCATRTCSSSPPTTATIRARRAPIIRASTCRC